MKQQNFKNHIRFYPPHHFVFYPAALLLLTFSLYQAYSHEEQQAVWIFISILLFLLIWLSFMLRQHYALTLQDRLISLETSYRYFRLAGRHLEIQDLLTKAQLFALRFASDDEFVDLVHRAIAENLSPGAIKKSIKNWKGDYSRV
ncbi:MAG TPA: DUF6526 family protein [Flavobacterium sp.]|nr:DUF6526 family protein [Flavobacterium sp.]